jgi:aliphatic nitrilase
MVADDAIAAYATTPELRQYLELEKTRRRATIVGPMGIIVAGPFEEEQEGILVADVGLDMLIDVKYVADYAGHYNRPELFAHHFKQYFES